jgi:hypothetical protein
MTKLLGSQGQWTVTRIAVTIRTARFNIKIAPRFAHTVCFAFHILLV